MHRREETKFSKYVKWLGLFLSLMLLSGLLVYLVEDLVEKNGEGLSFIAAVLNIGCCFVLILFIFAVTGKYRVAAIFGSILIYCIGIVNHFVLAFRGTPFLPADILSIGTAADVAGSYTICINAVILKTSILLIGMLICCCYFYSRISGNDKCSWKARLVMAITTIVMGLFVYQPSVWNYCEIERNTWNQLQGYQKNGTILSFVMNTRFLIVEEPEGYSSLQVEKILASVEEPISNDVNKQPDIIMIMNESYADMGVLGDFSTTKPYLTTLESLKENTIKGNLYVSVLGGGTCNSEFEALTGNTMAFLPSGVMAYQLYIDSPQYSLATTLKEQGYQTVAFHPGKADSWCRNEVYPLLGFDSFLTRNDMQQEEVIRGAYVSDASNYREIIRLYENRGEKPLFLFNVTIQNHGGYLLDGEGNLEQVNVVGEKNYPQANQYFSLMKASDQALQELLNYFSDVEEPVMIVFFGDHQPILEQDFTEQLLKTPLPSLSLEQMQLRHTCPFFIWTNYDIEEKNIERMSCNYLPATILQTAGLQMSKYDRYLLNLYQKLPVISGIGYIDAKGNYYGYEEHSEWTKQLDDYSIVQYNRFFDENGRQKEYFELNG